MLDHFAEYTDIVGDHPYNIASTNQVFNACAQMILDPCLSCPCSAAGTPGGHRQWVFPRSDQQSPACCCPISPLWLSRVVLPPPASLLSQTFCLCLHRRAHGLAAVQGSRAGLHGRLGPTLRREWRRHPQQRGARRHRAQVVGCASNTAPPGATCLWLRELLQRHVADNVFAT